MCPSLLWQQNSCSSRLTVRKIVLISSTNLYNGADGINTTAIQSFPRHNIKHTEADKAKMTAIKKVTNGLIFSNLLSSTVIGHLGTRYSSQYANITKALLDLPQMGREKFSYNGKPHGRNELISEYLRIAYHQSLRPGQRPNRTMTRDRKQVSSHIQVLKGFLKDHPACKIS
jgi:hypothetical protein